MPVGVMRRMTASPIIETLSPMAIRAENIGAIRRIGNAAVRLTAADPADWPSPASISGK